MSKISSATAAGAAEIEIRHFRAFAQDDATRTVIEQVVADLAIPNASVHKGGIREASRLLGEQRSPRLLVVDLTGVELPLSALNELAEVCEPGVTVITVGDRVATRWTAKGTHDGPLGPLDPTGKQVTIEGMIMDRYVD